MELGERDPVLRGPPQRVDPGGHVPHRVPVHVLVAVVIDGVVGLDPGGIDRELEAGAAVVIGIEHDRHVVRGGLVVPPAEQAHDAVGMGIEGADEDVEVVLVEGDPGLGAALGLRTLARLRLEEPVHRRGAGPDGVGAAAVEDRRFGGAGRADRRGGLERRGSRHLGLHQQQHTEQRCHHEPPHGKDARVRHRGEREGWAAAANPTA